MISTHFQIFSRKFYGPFQYKNSRSHLCLGNSLLFTHACILTDTHTHTQTRAVNTDCILYCPAHCYILHILHSILSIVQYKVCSIWSGTEVTCNVVLHRYVTLIPVAHVLRATSSPPSACAISHHGVSPFSLILLFHVFCL